jgi:hypothetical protein
METHMFDSDDAQHYKDKNRKLRFGQKDERLMIYNDDNADNKPLYWPNNLGCGRPLQQGSVRQLFTSVASIHSQNVVDRTTYTSFL